MNTLIVGCLFFAGLSWVILLASVASMQSTCGSANLTLGGTAGFNGPTDCKHLFSYPWWIVWFEFGILCAVGGLLNQLQRMRFVLLSFLSMCTVLLMDTANTFLYYNNLGSTTSLMSLSSVRATVAGSILCTVFNFLLIVALGIFDDVGSASGFKEGPSPGAAAAAL